jgi:hypothetical protein
MSPAGASIADMIAGLRALSAPPAIEERDEKELPERNGL